MQQLNRKQLERQDYVDNLIFKLVKDANPTAIDIPWNIEMIAEIREQIANWMVNKSKICEEMEFYPYIED